MNVAQITDCHLFADAGKYGYGNINPYNSLLQILQHLKQHRVELVVACGDISADGSNESYQHFLTLWHQSGISARLLVLPGNHDDIAIMHELFDPRLLWTASPATVGQWQVHGLNSKHLGNLGHVSVEDYASLNGKINASKDKFHLIAVHHHPLECDGWMDTHEWLNRHEFVALVNSLPQIRGVIYGHIHSEREAVHNECRYMACPSTCWQWANQQDFGLDHSQPGYRLLNLNDTGKIDSEVIRLTS